MITEHMLVRRTQWDDYHARLEEWWELMHLVRNWRGQMVWKPVMSHYAAEATIPIRGDLEWANKIAAHYKIPVPGVTK